MFLLQWFYNHPKANMIDAASTTDKHALAMLPYILCLAILPVGHLRDFNDRFTFYSFRFRLLVRQHLGGVVELDKVDRVGAVQGAKVILAEGRGVLSWWLAHSTVCNCCLGKVL